MAGQSHLLLQTVRLQSANEWVYQGDGVAFVLVQAGNGRHLAGAAVHGLGAGDVLILSGSGSGKLSPALPGELGLAWFSVSMEHLFPLFDGAEISVLQAVMDGLKGAKVYPAAEYTASESHRLLSQVPSQINLEYRSHLLRVASVILSVEFQTVRQRRNQPLPIEDRVVRIFEQLSNADILDQSVPQLASRFGCTRRHLDRLFLQYFGISASALRMEIRLVKAMSLLRNPEAKVTNVASDCGFNHLGLFNLRFKKRFGCSPGQWREEASQGIPLPTASQKRPAGGCRLRAVGLCPESFGEMSPGGASTARRS